MSDEQEYMLRWRGRESGPYPLSEINRRLDDHEIGMGHEIYSGDKWISLEEFFAASKPAAAPARQAPVVRATAKTPAPTAREKSSPLRIKVSVANPATTPPTKAAAMESGLKPRHRMVFALLGVFLGFLGAHNFYARQWLTGLLQLLLSVATYLMGFGIIASWLWAMAEAVFVRKDGEGLDMI